MSKTRFRSAAVIGTGMMGPGIAATLALGGVRATILSRSEENAAKGVDAARAQLRVLAENGLAEPVEVREAWDRIDSSCAFDPTIEKVDLVIESAPENMDLKQKMFVRLDAVAERSAVLASNTSGFSITAIASRCRHPERVLTTHFWNPPHLVPLQLVRAHAPVLQEPASFRRSIFVPSPNPLSSARRSPPPRRRGRDR